MSTLVEKSSSCNCDQFAQMVVDLNCQNEFLKVQYEGMKSLHCLESNGVQFDDGNRVLHEKIELLSREIREREQMHNAAEDALTHLRTAYTEADAKAQELETKLVQVQQKMEQEMKVRDDKNNELDLKLGRLHKRAKQRIQEIQKEKDDLEARLREVNEMAERGSSQQTSMQQELERTRQQANEALRALDVERQQLRTSNSKLRDTVEEERRLLEAKEKAFEEVQHSLFEKEQMLEEVRQLLQNAEEQKQASIAELSSKQQMHLASLESQLADALSDRSKAADTISALQVLLAVKESEIAEMDAALTGEAVRLKAAAETAKGEVIQMKHEHEKEKETWESAYRTLRTKLEVAEGIRLQFEIEAEKMRSQLELELSMKIQLLNTRDAELLAAKDEMIRLQSEFSAYKVRAHALFLKKDAELSAAKDSDLLKAQEEAVKKTTKLERDRGFLLGNDKDAALTYMEQRLRNTEIKLDSVNSNYRLEKESWQINLESLEEAWRIKCEALVAQNDVSTSQDLQRELKELKLRFRKLQEEHNSFRDIADRMIEEKDKEVSRLLDDNKNLHRSLLMKPSIEHNGNHNSDFQKQGGPISSTAAAEQQILILARQQAQREEELAQSQRHILALQEEVEELERENRLHNQQKPQDDDVLSVQSIGRRKTAGSRYIPAGERERQFSGRDRGRGSHPPVDTPLRDHYRQRPLGSPPRPPRHPYATTWQDDEYSSDSEEELRPQLRQKGKKNDIEALAKAISEQMHNVHLKIPEFTEKSDADAFIEWLDRLNCSTSEAYRGLSPYFGMVENAERAEGDVYPMNYGEVAFGKLQSLKMGLSSLDDYTDQYYLFEARARLHETEQQRLAKQANELHAQHRPPVPTATPTAPAMPVHHEAMLKEELRNMERMEKREGVDMTYLKNVVIKLLETGEVEALLPVIGMLLQFSPDEIQKCQQAYHSLTDVPPSPASDASASGPSLFSRFSFS
ncbi:hypothetical protein GIB67_030063 [Kingdonia uniflora]|uniref:GRIP domain-containing protein n=1 Tax=Kingdonia uniflora TaxID=39325 RepID=A0A7J7MY06_9MAGN|nr:hypothetical protein GIB67_030063 [Kingdonia uniflora]